MAIGATPAGVLALVFRQGLTAVAAGLAVGMGAAWTAMRSLDRVLPGLEPARAGYLWTAAAVVAGAALFACAVPAVRATRTDPVSALRRE
jgi:ABC-type lipoprotein release transport system permease subunit